MDQKDRDSLLGACEMAQAFGEDRAQLPIRTVVSLILVADCGARLLAAMTEYIAQLEQEAAVLATPERQADIGKERAERRAVWNRTVAKALRKRMGAAVTSAADDSKPDHRFTPTAVYVKHEKDGPLEESELDAKGQAVDINQFMARPEKEGQE